VFETFQRVLVTGCAGYLGRNLIPMLREQVLRGGLVGTSRRAQAPEVEHQLDAYASADLFSADATRNLIESTRPGLVIHLATGRAGTLEQLLRANVVATDNLLRAVREVTGNDVRVVVVGSSAEIGFCRDEDLPLAESAICEPVNDYGVSKLSQSYLARASYLSYGQSTVRVRAFNLVGPGLSATLLPGRCVELLKANLSARNKVRLSFGNLETRRDYTDARDVCRAILLAARFGRVGALYHIGSGKAFSGYEVVRGLAAEAGVEVECETDETWAKRGEALPVQIADSRLAERELSWRPQITFRQSIKDMWQHALANPK
jgi:GDP-4-dehydro-6-deoxy-D-mannose reductase